jgi:hypothetical protein
LDSLLCLVVAKLVNDDGGQVIVDCEMLATNQIRQKYTSGVVFIVKDIKKQQDKVDHSVLHNPFAIAWFILGAYQKINHAIAKGLCRTE